MKHLQLKTEGYAYVEKSFKEWLEIGGYNDNAIYGLPLHVREMLHYFEQKNICQLKQLKNTKIKKYYHDHLQTRANKTRGGALSSASLNKHQQAIKLFIKYLNQVGRINLPNIRFESETNHTNQVTVLSQLEVEALIKATAWLPENPHLHKLRERDKAIITIYYSCGLRRSEGIALNVEDVHFDKKYIHVKKGKNNKQRLVPLTKQSLVYLQDYIYNSRPQYPRSKENQALLVSLKGNRMNGQSALLRIKLLQLRVPNVELQDKQIGLHTLRHSIATHLLQNGMPMESISNFLGHSSLESTQLYTHLIKTINHKT